MEYIPYTYLIGWTNINKWYYGVEYGMKKNPCANPENFWKSYFTSSNIVEYYRHTYGEPDVIQIRKIFNVGLPEERMIKSIHWEKKVLNKIDITNDKWINGRIGGDICPETNKKIASIRYGVDNVFQSDEIKNKIKQTMVERFGVEHPSYSLELLEKKKRNNIEKYGISCLLNLPETKEKCLNVIRSEKVKNKRKETNSNRHGVEYISQNLEIKEKILETRKKLSDRDVVKLIREYNRIFSHKLGEGWYQKTDEELKIIVEILQNLYGTYSYEELKNTNPDKKYRNSIKKLQERPIVIEIKKYKEKYKRKITIGRSWDRKSEQELELILIELIKKYGEI